MPVLNKLFFRNITYNLILLFILPFLIYLKKPAVFYIRQSPFLISPFLASKLFNVPVISEINGALEEELILNKDFKSIILINRVVERISCSTPIKIIAVTDKLKRRIIKKYGLLKNKVVVLENGVDSNLFYPLKKDKKYDVLFVGSFMAWQGLNYLMKSVPDARKRFRDVKFLLIGDGIEMENLHKLVKELKIERNVIFAGYKTHEQIPDYINQSSICIAPFALDDRNKKTGISAFKIYEYASCGKPIVSTNISGISDFIIKNNCGVIVEPNNSKALADAIIKLLNNPKLAEEMGRNGRKTILNGYSWKNVAERTQKVIEDTISEHNKN